MSNAYVEAETWQPQLQGLQRVDLLKKLETLTRETFETSQKYEEERASHGSSEDDRKKVLDAACEQQWQGIEEYTDKWLQVYDACSVRQKINRQAVIWALDNLEHGFNELEKALIYHGAIIAELNDEWFKKWIRHHQSSELAKQLTGDDKNGKIPKEFYNHYTVINRTGEGEYTQVSYGEFYQEEVSAITAAMRELISQLKSLKMQDEPAVEQYIKFFEVYISCLEEKDVEKLEGLWAELDKAWIGIKYWIQVVHDIEYGYGEPLRCKVDPQFSVRLLDETFKEQNEQIKQIHNLMVEYFKQRPGQMAQEGLESLRQTFAGIYYLPFLCGTNLHFRFSGQSIPNRAEIRNSHGSKIYFDYLATFQREELAKSLARSILHDKEMADDIITLETIVYHIAAHEIGHAIYSLENLTNIDSQTRTLMEEPRAELTALHTLKLMVESGMIDEVQMNRYLCSFMLQDLRRFSMFDSSAIRPYTISAMQCWDNANKHGMVGITDEGKVKMQKGDPMKAFIDYNSNLFEQILDAEDIQDVLTIQQIQKTLEGSEQSKTVQHLLDQLFHKRVQDVK